MEEALRPGEERCFVLLPSPLHPSLEFSPPFKRLKQKRPLGVYPVLGKHGGGRRDGRASGRAGEMREWGKYDRVREGKGARCVRYVDRKGEVG